MTTEVNDRACPQCAAAPGELHKEWDTIARCYETGEQLVACESEHDNTCWPSRWDGEYPGVKQCRALGMYFTDPRIGVTEDLNKFAVIPKDWNRETQSWDIPDWMIMRLTKERTDA